MKKESVKKEKKRRVTELMESFSVKGTFAHAF